MDSLRRRVPFKVEGEDVAAFLDEQEQDEVVEELRKANATSNAHYQLWIQALLGLSLLAQFFYLFTPSKRTPLANIFPVSDDSPLPLSTVFAITSIVIHLNLSLLCQSPLFHLFDAHTQPKPLPFDLTYAISAVAPSLALFTRKSWQTTIWWCITPFIVFVTQAVLSAMEAGNHSVAELDNMKYRAPGA